MKKHVKNSRFSSHVYYNLFYLVVIAIIILLSRNCSGEKELNYNKQLQVKNDSINLLNKNIADLKNQKAVLIIVNGDSLGHSGKFVEAIIAPENDQRKSSLFIKDVVKKIEVPAPTAKLIATVEILPILESESLYLQKEKDFCIDKVCLDSLVYKKLNFSLIKQYQNDEPMILTEGEMSVKDIVSGSLLPYSYNNKYIEYLENPYRVKSEKSFWGGVAFGSSAIILYGISEALGHPVFIDGRDNSSAKRKSNSILGLRIGSSIFAGASLVEFSRAVHFHHMEGKFIINPASVGLKIDLNKPRN